MLFACIKYTVTKEREVNILIQMSIVEECVISSKDLKESFIEKITTTPTTTYNAWSQSMTY